MLFQLRFYWLIVYLLHFLKKTKLLVSKIYFCYPQAIWHHLYDTKSARDTGALYAMRNAVDARNVSNDPQNCYYAIEFIDKVTDTYFINGALVDLGMASVEDQPTRNIYEGSALDNNG